MLQEKMLGKVYLVTGASGFIGSSLCAELSKQGAYVKVLLRSRSEGKWDESFIYELGQQEVPKKAIRDVDVIFHLAGRTHALVDGHRQDQLYFKTNVEGTRVLLESAKIAKVKKFIFFSSVKAMGEECHTRLDENTQSLPISAYGKSKLAAENLVLHGKYVKHPTVLRLPMVYGNTDKGNLPKMIKAISKNQFPPLPKIINKRSMVHVDDVVSGAIKVASNDISSGKIYIVSDGIDYSTRELYENILLSMGRSVPSWGLPVSSLKLLAKIGDLFKMISGKRLLLDSDNLQKLIGNSFYSSDKIKTELGFVPSHTAYNSMSDIISNLNLK